MTGTRPCLGPWGDPCEDLVGASVAPGVWVTALPFPTPLHYSLSYLVESSGGLLAVDLGWNTDESWRRFLRGLERAGKTLDDIAGVVVTHAHPDHYGLAGRVRGSSGAWLAVQPAERPQFALNQAEARQRLADMERWLVRCGAPDLEVTCLRDEAAEIAAHLPRVRPDLDLVDHAPVRGTDGSLIAVHTPGHTPGSVCFSDLERNLVFTGDHVLPRITPNISKRPTSDEDPLQEYLRSLQRVNAFVADDQVFALPGHEWGFAGLSWRLTEVDEHHAERLAEMEAAVHQGHDTVWTVAQAVHWSRPFASLTSRARRSAIGETYSHLYRLYRAKRLHFVPGVPERWSVPFTRSN